MAFSVKRRGGASQLRTRAFISHARVGVGIYAIAAILVVAILPTLKIPQFLAVIVLVPLIWNQWYARGWYVRLDDDGLTDVLRRGDAERLAWHDVGAFEVIDHMAPSNLLFLGRGDEHACFVVQALRAEADDEPVILWATAGYGVSVAQPDAREATQAVADYLEAQRLEARAPGSPDR